MTFFLYVSVFQGLTLGVFLLFIKSEKNLANVFLGLAVLFFTAHLLPGAVARLGWIQQLPHLIDIGRIFILAMGPFTYLYIKANIRDAFVMQRKDWYHFIPTLLMFFVNIPFFFQSGDAKLAYFLSPEARLNDTGYMMQSSLNVLSIIIYFAFAIQMVLQYRKHQQNTSSSIKTIFHRWLLGYCGLLLFPILVITLYGFTGFVVIPAIVVVFSFFFFIVTIYLANLIKPELFHQFPHQMPTLDKETEKKHKYESSNLQPAQKERYLKKVLNFMEEDKPYLEHELTLAQLAEQVKIPSYHLSRIINEEKKCNFLDFINNYRVQEVKEKLADKKYNHLTILSIAFDVGFNSKTAFYTSFKKQTGTTPTKYRKAQKLLLKESA